MKNLQLSLRESSILSVVSHPDDAEMHHVGLLTYARSGYAIVATDGEASTKDFARRSLC